MDESKNRQNFIGMFLLLLLAALIAFLLTWWLKKDLNQSLQNTLILIAAGFLSQVTLGFSRNFIKQVANQGGNIFSAARRRYLQYLIYRNRYFETKGLSAQPEFNLELEKMFVELKFQSKSNESPSEEAAGIWDLLQEYRLEGKRKIPPKLVLIGVPGSGKTTLIRQITVMLSKGSIYKVAPKLQGKLPVFLLLRELGKLIGMDQYVTLGQFIVKSLRENASALPSADWFMSQIRRGNCIIMLDGLDEIAEEAERQQAIEWVQEQLDLYPKNHFIMTSRPFGYESNPLRGVSVHVIRQYSRDQIETFIHNWYHANEMAKSGSDDLGVRMNAEENADDLMARLLGRPALAALAVNPLLLTMIATVHSLKEHLPGRRVELYRDICEVTLERRRKLLWSTSNLNTPQKIDVLKSLAYHMMLNEIRTIPTADAVQAIKRDLDAVGAKVDGEKFLRNIELDSGLLLEIENGIYAFAHLTFQEYLASVYIRDERDALEEPLVSNVTKSWWGETIRLYAAQTDATQIVDQCLMDGTTQSLSLATDCLDEALRIDGGIREELENILNDKMESNEPETRAIVSKAKLASRLRWMVRLNEEASIDANLVTSIEYQLFLDEMKAQGQYFYPDHWVSDRFEENNGPLPITGIRAQDAIDFCSWLTKRDIWSNIYRIPTQEEVMGQDCINDLPYWTTMNELLVVFPEGSAITRLGRDEIFHQVNSDIERIKNMSNTFGERAKKPPLTAELLSKTAIWPSATGTTDKIFGAPQRDKVLEFESLARFRGHRLLSRVEAFSQLYNLETTAIIEYFVELNRLNPRLREDMARKIRGSNETMPYYRSDFDLGKTLQSALESIIQPNISSQFTSNVSLILSTFQQLLQMLIRRSWAGISEAEERDIIYSYIRLCCRICALILLHEEKNTGRETSIGNFLRDLFIDLTIIERRIRPEGRYENMPKEGIRLVKQTPIRL